MTRPRFAAETRAVSAQRPGVYASSGMEGFACARQAYAFAYRLARLRSRNSIDGSASWSIARVLYPGKAAEAYLAPFHRPVASGVVFNASHRWGRS